MITKITIHPSNYNGDSELLEAVMKLEKQGWKQDCKFDVIVEVGSERFKKYAINMKKDLPNVFNEQALVKSKNYTLRAEGGRWLGQIVITSDGMFSGVTDYGNLGFAWRSFGNVDFRKFLLDMDVHYFGGKMAQGIGYIAHSRQITKACERFAEEILPALQMALKTDLEQNPNW